MKSARFHGGTGSLAAVNLMALEPVQSVVGAKLLVLLVLLAAGKIFGTKHPSRQ
jgi:hypothetical protein